MITLLHGDHIEASRRELNRLREVSAAKEIRSIDGRTVDQASLIQALESSSLFGTETITCIEQLFSKITKSPKKIQEFCDILNRQPAENEIILWEDRELGVSVCKLLPKDTKILLFKTPVIIFRFLDSLTPGNAEKLLAVFADLCPAESEELIFAMTVKRFRQLIQLSGGVAPAGLAGWQLNRLTLQAKSFTMKQLIDMYTMLHDIEVSIKTGMSPYTLHQHIELFIVKI
jgi:DNA polymerase III delta subunit